MDELSALLSDSITASGLALATLATSILTIEYEQNHSQKKSFSFGYK